MEINEQQNLFLACLIIQITINERNTVITSVMSHLRSAMLSPNNIVVQLRLRYSTAFQFPLDRSDNPLRHLQHAVGLLGYFGKLAAVVLSHKPVQGFAVMFFVGWKCSEYSAIGFSCKRTFEPSFERPCGTPTCPPAPSYAHVGVSF